MNYTHGPWEISGTKGQLICDHVNDDYKSIIAELYARGGYPDFSEMQANACLIAAAPDLYEALIAVCESVYKEYGELDIVTLSKIEAALAKAQGE